MEQLRWLALSLGRMADPVHRPRGFFLENEEMNSIDHSRIDQGVQCPGDLCRITIGVSERARDAEIQTKTEQARERLREVSKVESRSAICDTRTWRT